jgi:hypothetical protein
MLVRREFLRSSLLAVGVSVCAKTERLTTARPSSYRRFAH